MLLNCALSLSQVGDKYIYIYSCLCGGDTSIHTVVFGGGGGGNMCVFMYVSARAYVNMCKNLVLDAILYTRCVHACVHARVHVCALQFIFLL